METLGGKFPIETTSIDSIRFYEPEEINAPAHVEVITTIDKDGILPYHYCYFFELAYKYYESLKTAESAGDFMKYVEILNLCFKEMERVNKEGSTSTLNFEFDQEQAKQFNELFNLNEYGLNQVGFLPKYVDFVFEEKGDVNCITYIIKGLSFVEVESGEGDCVLPKDLSNAILNQELNKKDIKVYETDFKLTYELEEGLRIFSDAFLIVLNEYFKGGEQTAQNLKVVPTYVHEIDLTSFKMHENIFDFEKTK